MVEIQLVLAAFALMSSMAMDDGSASGALVSQPDDMAMDEGSDLMMSQPDDLVLEIVSRVCDPKQVARFGYGSRIAHRLTRIHGA